MNNNINLIACALSYASRGWHVIPLHSIAKDQCTCKRQCRSPGKHPILSKWQIKASVDPSQIGQWWEKYPNANIGIVTGKQSGLVIIDIDPRNGGDASLQNLIDTYPEFKPILATYEVRTGGNGVHFYYAHNKPFKSFKRHGLGEGIDIKADGGYILAPPSNHISDNTYSVVNDIYPKEMPEILIDLILQNQSINKPKLIMEGNRNNWLAEQAGEQFRLGKSFQEVENFLLEENTLFCRPSVEHEEVLSITRSMASGFKLEAKQKSFKTQWQEAILESGLGAGFTHACIGLSLWMNSDGRNCWPTGDQLEERLHVTRKTLRLHFRKAEQAGFLSKYMRSRKGKRGFSYGYIAKLPNQDG